MTAIDASARMGTGSADIEPETARPEPHAGRDPLGAKPASEIERGIARTRAELSETLDALERRLAPWQLMEKGVDMLHGSMDDHLATLGERLRANPFPLILVGAGLGWLALSQTGGARNGAATNANVNGARRRAADVAEHMGAAARDAASYVKDAVGETVDRAADATSTYARAKADVLQDRLAGYSAEARERLEAMQAKASETLDRAVDEAGAVAGQARDRVSRMVDENPLAVGALSLLAGAAIAMLLPRGRSRQE